MEADLHKRVREAESGERDAQFKKMRLEFETLLRGKHSEMQLQREEFHKIAQAKEKELLAAKQRSRSLEE